MLHCHFYIVTDKGFFILKDMSEAEKRRNKEHKEINSEVKLEPKVTSMDMFYFSYLQDWHRVGTPNNGQGDGEAKERPFNWLHDEPQPWDH